MASEISPSKEREKNIGILHGTLGALTYGWILIFAKLAYQAGMDTFVLLRDRFGLAALLLWGYYLFFARKTLAFNSKNVVIGLLLGAVGYGTMVLAYFYALNFISASLTALILYLTPSLTTIFARIFFKEPLTLEKGLALLLPFSGAALIIGFQIGTVDYRGILFALLAVLLSSLYVIVTQTVLKKASPRTMALLIITGAALFYSFFENPFTFLAGMSNLKVMVPLLLLVFISTIPPIFFSLSAIEKLGGARTTMLSPLDPLMTVVAAYLILGERLTPIQMLGAVTIIAGVLLVYRT